MYSKLRPLLFKFEPEKVHESTIQLLKVAGQVPLAGWLMRHVFSAPENPVEVFGLQFKNPVGLAAGYDKDGLGWRGLVCLGFSHIEIGTITKKPQPGNPKPRVFRLIEDEALVNRMGFPGRGANFAATRLRQRKRTGLILGINIGKNKDTLIENASDEYAELFEMFAPLGDYVAVNISSPNTAGLRRLQAREALNDLLRKLSTVRNERTAGNRKNPIPILVKLAPDLTDWELEDALDVILSCGMDGVIATNTTIERHGLASENAREGGGLSGAPLFGKSLAVVKKIVDSTSGKLPVIGVGGIVKPDDARKMLDCGAVLVQVYTGLIYAGPGLVAQINRSLAK